MTCALIIDLGPKITSQLPCQGHLKLVCTASELIFKDAWYVSQYEKVQDFLDWFPDWKIQENKLFVHNPDP